MPHEFIESRIEMEALLHEESVGWLAMSRDGKSYVVPLNYAYVDGRILFHCALEGLKLDFIRANPDVCFSVGRQPGVVRRHGGGDVCHVDSDSVICFGRARVIVDNPERAVLLNAFNRAFRPNADDIPENQIRRCAVIEITVDEMTGRRESARERTLWRHVFARKGAGA